MIRDLPPRVNPFAVFVKRHEEEIAWAWLSVELIGKFALCVASIVMGCSIALRSTNEGYTILAALACALIIGWAFGKERKMEQQQPIITGNHVDRGEHGERVVTQRCIGYQRYNPVGELASVFESVWSDGVTTYSMMWTDAHGNAHMSHTTDRRPRIDVAQTGKRG